jgi:hypothetical protein
MGATEKRTQIYLTGRQHRAAMALARRRGESLASVVRQALDSYLADEVHDAEANWEGDPAYALIGGLALSSGSNPASLPEDIDHVLYEEGTDAWSSPTAPASSPPSTPGTAHMRKPPRHGVRSRKRANDSSRHNSS